jgi:hypothetical protein
MSARGARVQHSGRRRYNLLGPGTEVQAAMLHSRMSAVECVLDAMRSGAWLRTQWIARVVSRLGSVPGPHPREYGATRRIVRVLAASGRVEHRDAHEHRQGDIGGVPVRFAIPRQEWRLCG